MKVIFQEAEQAITIEQIREVEQKFKIRFPYSYINHLLKYNGGYPNKCMFDAENTGSSIHDFYSLIYGEGGTFEEAYFDYKIEQVRMLPFIFPIAHDAFGNQVCLSIGKDDYESVYFWDHEEETEPPSYANMYLIAKSFPEFLEGLHEEDS